MFYIVLGCIHNLEPLKQESNRYVCMCVCLSLCVGGGQREREKMYSNIYRT